MEDIINLLMDGEGVTCLVLFEKRGFFWGVDLDLDVDGTTRTTSSSSSTRRVFFLGDSVRSMTGSVMSLRFDLGMI